MLRWRRQNFERTRQVTELVFRKCFTRVLFKFPWVCLPIPRKTLPEDPTFKLLSGYLVSTFEGDHVFLARLNLEMAKHGSEKLCVFRYSLLECIGFTRMLGYLLFICFRAISMLVWKSLEFFCNDAILCIDCRRLAQVVPEGFSDLRRI